MFPRYGIGKDVRDILPNIAEYFGRQFTHQRDALDAFLGILSVFERSKALNGHLGGLPVFSPDTWALTSSFTQLDMVVYSLAWFMIAWQRDPRETAIFRRPHFPSWTWIGWCLEGNQTGGKLYFPYPFAREQSYKIIAELESNTILSLPIPSIPLNIVSKIDPVLNYPKHLEIRAWAAELDLHNENILSSLRFPIFWPKGKKNQELKLWKDLTLLTIKLFKSVGCSDLDFEDILLICMLEEDSAGSYILILCYDPKMNGYTRLHGLQIYLSKNHREGPIIKHYNGRTFKQRVIKLV